MRRLFPILLIAFAPFAASAEEYYAQQAAITPPQQYQVQQAQPQPYYPQQHAPVQQYNQLSPMAGTAQQPERPGEYGQSVVTDIRQMNF